MKRLEQRLWIFLLPLFLLSCPATFAQVPFERIVNADKEPGNWLTYSRDLQGHRFSPLTEINTQNVSQIKVKWAFQFPDDRTEVSPIVIDSVLYITGPNSAAALDGRTGRALDLQASDSFGLSLHRLRPHQSWPRRSG